MPTLFNSEENDPGEFDARSDLLSTDASAELRGTTLHVAGSSLNDVIHIERGTTGRWITVTWNGSELGRQDVDTNIFDGKSGDDEIYVSPLVVATTLLEGGLGNDILVGSKLASNILLGGLGRDWFFAGQDDELDDRFLEIVENR